jgi:hypothetical protein
MSFHFTVATEQNLLCPWRFNDARGSTVRRSPTTLVAPVATSVLKNVSRDFLLLVREGYHLQLREDTPRFDAHRYIACLSAANEKGKFRVRQCEH